MRTLIAIGCLLVACAAAAADDVAPVIVNVAVTTHGQAADWDIPGTLGLEPGGRLDRARVRHGIQVLMATGEFAWIRVDGSEVEGGLDVAVEADLFPRLSSLEVEAPSIVWKFRVRRWLGFEVGEPVNARRIEAAARRITRKIVRAGYPEAEISPYLTLDRATNQVAATFVVDPGPEAVLDHVRLVGLPEGADETEITRGLGHGKTLKDETIEDLRDRIENRLRMQGWWEAKVVSFERTGPPAATVMVATVEVGPRYRLDLEAPAGLEKVARESLPDVADEDLNPAQTDALAETIVERLQKRGFPLAKATVSLDEGETESVLRVVADPGPKARVSRVEFPGANEVDPDLLRRSITTGKGSGKASRPLTEESLETDRRTLEALYRSLGFQDATVAPAVVERAQDGGIVVRFAVDEGLRWSIESFTVVGAPAEALAVTDSDEFQLEVTDPWDPDELDNLVGRWQRAMADVGYPEAAIKPVVETPEVGRVTVVLYVDPGPFVRVGRILISGLTETRRGVVERTLEAAGLRRGVAYSAATIADARQALYRLGLFRRAEIVPIPGQERRSERGLVVRLEEGLQHSYLAGLGWGTDDRVRVTLGWSHLNLFGGGHALSIETRYSAREFRYQLGLREPVLPWIGEPGYFALYRTEEQFTDWNQLRYGLWFEVGDRLARPFRHWVRYEYQAVEPNAPEEILSELEREQQQIDLSSVSVPFEWDRRNDLLSPTRGYLVSIAPEMAFPLFHAKSEFFKLRARYSHYLDLGDFRLNLGVRAGAIILANPDPEQPENLQVPLAARFFAGGPTTHRAFQTDRLGIPGQTLEADGKAIGGNAMVLINAELIRPVWGDLAAVVFVDGGNVWATPRDVNVGDLRWGVGAGLRYDTPAGPFRAEYGRKLRRLSGESAGEIHVSFGMTF